MRSISTAISCFILHFSTFMSMLLLFRPYQLMGVKREVILVCCFGYCFHAIYIIALRALEISHSKSSYIQLIPNKVIIVISVCLQISNKFLTNYFCIGQTRGSHVSFFLQMTASPISLVILAAPMADIYNKQNKDGKLLIALFSPLTGVLLKVISRVSVQWLCSKSVHPGYSYICLIPLYCCTAVMFRVLQADLWQFAIYSGADLGGGCRGCAPLPEMTYGFLIQLVLCKKQKKVWFIGVSYAIP